MNYGYVGPEMGKVNTGSVNEGCLCRTFNARPFSLCSVCCRTTMHQCTVGDVMYRSGLDGTNDQTNLGEHVSPESQMTHDVRESQGPSEVNNSSFSMALFTYGKLLKVLNCTFKR